MQTTNDAIRHLKRWIKASFLKEFKLHLKGQMMFVEGEERLTNTNYQHLEFRLDGPYLKPLGPEHYKAYIEVNLLANCTRNEENKYWRENLEGTMMHILNRDVCIYKIGNVGIEDEDDGTLLEIMNHLNVDMIKVSDFGQIDPNTQVFQATAEAHYEMYFNLPAITG